MERKRERGVGHRHRRLEECLAVLEERGWRTVFSVHACEPRCPRTSSPGCDKEAHDAHPVSPSPARGVKSVQGGQRSIFRCLLFPALRKHRSQTCDRYRISKESTALPRRQQQLHVICRERLIKEMTVTLSIPDIFIEICLTFVSLHASNTQTAPTNLIMKVLPTSIHMLVRREYFRF